MAQAEGKLPMTQTYKIKNNLPFFYIKADEELAVKVVNLFSSIYNRFLYVQKVRDGKIAFDNVHISCESERCDVAYEMLEFKNQQIALIYLPFECYRFQEETSQKLFIDLANRELEISRDDDLYHSILYEELKPLLNDLLIDPDWYSAFFEAMLNEDNDNDIKFYRIRLSCLNRFLLWFNNNIKEIPEDLWAHIVDEVLEKKSGGFYGIHFYKEKEVVTIVSPVYLSYFRESLYQYWEREEHYALTGRLLKNVDEEE